MRQLIIGVNTVVRHDPISSWLNPGIWNHAYGGNPDMEELWIRKADYKGYSNFYCEDDQCL